MDALRLQNNDCKTPGQGPLKYTIKTFTRGRTDHFVADVPNFQFSIQLSFSSRLHVAVSQFHSFDFNRKRDIFILLPWTLTRDDHAKYLGQVISFDTDKHNRLTAVHGLYTAVDKY